MSFSRHRLREAAFQTLFALDASPEIDQYPIFQEVLTLNPKEPVPEFAQQLVEGVLSHQDELDEKISASLAKGWTLARVARPNVIILRLAIYELEYDQSTPAPVVINEALQLAKTFSDDKSRRFVNGVLGNITGHQASE